MYVRAKEKEEQKWGRDELERIFTEQERVKKQGWLAQIQRTGNCGCEWFRCPSKWKRYSLFYNAKSVITYIYTETLRAERLRSMKHLKWTFYMLLFPEQDSSMINTFNFIKLTIKDRISLCNMKRLNKYTCTTQCTWIKFHNSAHKKWFQLSFSTFHACLPMHIIEYSCYFSIGPWKSCCTHHLWRERGPGPCLKDQKAVQSQRICRLQAQRCHVRKGQGREDASFQLSLWNGHSGPDSKCTALL